MGQRANLIVVEGGHTAVHYDHWCANRLDVDLLWGPDDAVAFARQRSPLPESEPLLDEVWCEGAALIDLDRRRLLWFGGEDITYDVPRRRAWQAMMQHAWPGWTLRWACGGIAEIARAMGRPVGALLSDRARAPLQLRQGTSPDDNDLLYTEQRASNLRAWRVVGFAQYPALPPAGGTPPASAEIALPATIDASALVGAVHVDRDACSIQAWGAAPLPDAMTRLQRACWPGFELRWLEDRYEDHAAELPGLRLERRPQPELCAALLEHLERFVDYPAKDPSQDSAEALRAQGYQVEVRAHTAETRGSPGNPARRLALLEELRARFSAWDAPAE